MANKENLNHPGMYIRERVIPKDMTVKEAAARIGVGRPALSNLLNGKASLSNDMAVRLERAFGVESDLLMQKQAEFEGVERPQKTKALAISTYVPPFLGVKAVEIERWATGNIQARNRLPVLLRTLIHSTGIGLSKVEFPGNDDAERIGWDGEVEASTGTPWVPAGISRWEFGVNQYPKTKANSDIAKRTQSTSEAERQATVFVFVTPRRWAGRAQWEESMKGKGGWKDVRAYDAQSLEQWMEQSIAGQVWFANETNIYAEDIRSLDRCWSDWADVTNPMMAGGLFEQSVEAAKRTIEGRLSSRQKEPTMIAADSVEEGLAFLAQLFSERGGEKLSSLRDQVLVFDKPDAIRKLVRGAQEFIPVVYTRDTERAIAPYVKNLNWIAIYPHNTAGIQCHIELKPIDQESFRRALEEMSFERDNIQRLANESGRSLTVLRRRLSFDHAVRVPQWSDNHDIAISLIPMLFAGTWNQNNEADVKGMERLSRNVGYQGIEEECQRLVRGHDAPVWSIGSMRGVVSKIDMLFAIASYLTGDDLNRFFSVARDVLGEDDPLLDLNKDEKWTAQMRGIGKKYSSAFHDGIVETLVLLAISSNLFRDRLGVDTSYEAEKIVRELLQTPLSTRTLELHDKNLPLYAEVAPEAFLAIIEEDLKTSSPAVMGLMTPVDTDIFGGGMKRSGLLWALEGLAWSPKTVLRSALILAELSTVKIDDNWGNKPIRSLESIFRDWMPQTAANFDDRLKVLKKITERFPSIAWEVCIAQFGSHRSVGNYSHKPRWRPDGYGHGEPISTWDPILQFRQEMVNIAIDWKEHSLEQLSSLIERLHSIKKEDQRSVWRIVRTWADERATDQERAELREKIRVTLLTTRAGRRNKNRGDAGVLLTKEAKAAFDFLEPTDLRDKHGWLFRDTWVEESANEIHGEDIDFDGRDARIRLQRVAALTEILKELGLQGLLEITKRGRAAWVIGRLLPEILTPDQLVTYAKTALQQSLSPSDGASSYKNVVSGILHVVHDGKYLSEFFTNISDGMSDEEKAVVLMLAPFCVTVWDLVGGLAPSEKSKYWLQVMPEMHHLTDSELVVSIEELLKAKRPRAVFSGIKYRLKDLGVTTIYRVLTDLVKGDAQEDVHYRLDEHWVKEAFKAISTTNELSLEDKAGVEFAYIDVLARLWGSESKEAGIPNLERYVELHPEFYVQAIAWVYKRDDNEVDPPEYQVSPEKKSVMAEKGYKLLEGLELIPGLSADERMRAEILSKWITTVRDLCRQIAREEVGDACLGKLLSTAPTGSDGVWPCEPVRQVMEEIHSVHLMNGAHTGLYNSRGVHFRARGGDQERALADKYRTWAESLQFTHPFVSSELLMGMVNTYEREAGREDTEAAIRDRLQ